MSWTKKNTTNLGDLRRMLHELTSVRVRNWDGVMELHEALARKKARVVHKAWDDEVYNNNPRVWPLDLTELATWSTYDARECIDLEYKLHRTGIQVQVQIYEGRNDRYFDRPRRKFNAVINLPLAFLRTEALANRIDWDFDALVEHRRHDQRKDKKEAWLAKERKKLLEDKRIFRKSVTFAPSWA
jgi:hypothetical protein